MPFKHFQVNSQYQYFCIKFVCILVLTSSVLPHKNVCLSNGSHNNVPVCLPSIHILFSMNDWVLAFISTIHDFYSFCKWTFQTTQYVCEHFVEWTCKELFFGICNLAQIVSEICINYKLRIFLIWNSTLNMWSSFLYLGYIDDTFLVQSSAFITNHIIFLYFSVDKFWNIFLQRLNFYWPSSLDVIYHKLHTGMPLASLQIHMGTFKHSNTSN